MNTITKGKKGEMMAWRLLAAKGFRLLHRNYRYGRAEVDLIIGKGDLVVFVEVKMRNSTAYGYPEASVSKSQQNRIHSAARHYQGHLPSQMRIRFDVISIVKTGNRLVTRHLEDAF